MGKARLCILLAAALILVGAAEVQAAPARAPAPDELKAEAAFLLDVETEKILYEKNADQPMPPASTTKILTALLLLENAPLGEVVTVGEEVGKIGPDSSVAKLKPRDRLTVGELVYALLLPSGNDAAYTAAVFVGRRISGFEHLPIDKAVASFVELMNKRARELGAVNSNFVVPDGYDTPGHVSTARDLALIALAAMENDFLRQAAATTEYHWQGRRWGNTNRLLLQEYPDAYYPWATGLKTGYTGEAGHCLVATAQGGGRELIGVILKSDQKERWADIRRLLEYGFNCWRHYRMFVEGRQIFTVSVKGLGGNQMLRILAADSWSDLLSVEQIDNLELEYRWRRGVVSAREKGLALKAPIRKGQVVGMAVISLEGEVLGEVAMVAAASVGMHYLWLPALGGLMLALVVLLLLRHRRPPVQAGQ
ncbi:MAG TPA: D-alanyl-D-alanine carboxypeptidase family protein [Bacillota bacterium]|nr:D-alanyl-D-alanine carboxypeptidase family protein [Bacillota bacterium]